ncbi:hypothetical protein LZC95_07895 [Pendulispora brunnea]|uniref:Uncharacterized protein n=1 Tax=Pendulispora brunnea TaxID=2905690 RepID=A0ABZ2KGT5_9BACT
MALFLSGLGPLSRDTASRVRSLAERHNVRFICDDDDATRFRFEADDETTARTFTIALRRNVELYLLLQEEADLFEETIE